MFLIKNQDLISFYIFFQDGQKFDVASYVAGDVESYVANDMAANMTDDVAFSENPGPLVVGFILKLGH